jgi:Acetyltransferase (GNAT) domain
VKARLIEDGGRAASDPAQFFRSPQFLEAEHVTHTLVFEGDGELHLPVIVRPIEGDQRRDAVSPYGYPGAAELPGEPADPAAVDWSETGLVSLFVRDRVGERTCLAHGTLRSHVHVAEGPDGIRKRLREQIRRNERRGWQIEVVSGGNVDRDSLGAFERAYAETMVRTDAAGRYFFSSEHFERLLRSEQSWLLVASPGDIAERVAGAIAVASDGYLHYYLGGTADEALADSPMKNLFAAMIELGNQLGLPISLGGGVKPGDSLDEFKRGFAGSQAPWHTHEVVCDPAAYEELSLRRAPAAPQDFFPAYRA